MGSFFLKKKFNPLLFLPSLTAMEVNATFEVILVQKKQHHSYKVILKILK